MCKMALRKMLVTGFIVIFQLLLFPSFQYSETLSKGNIIGFIYASDGSTPLTGAVIKVKNISTGSIYKSTVSDKNGIFTIDGIESGLFQYGVISPDGDFIAQDVFGIKISNNETVKMSIALSPYEEKVKEGMQDILPEQKIAGEAYVGRIVEFTPDKKIASIYIVKGFLQYKHRIHTKGEKTDFYQSVREMRAEGQETERLFPGQTAFIPMENNCEIGDAVYVVSKKGLIPLFLTPVGSAAIIAATAGVIYKVGDLAKDKVKAVSAHRY